MQQVLVKHTENLDAKASGQSENATADSSSTTVGPLPSSTEGLWNEAYDELKKTEIPLMNRYEAMLAEKLNKTISGATIATQSNLRRTQMNEILTESLEKTENQAMLKKTVGEIARQLTAFKDVISLGLKPSPEATIAWTALTAALPFITNLTEQSEKLRTGIKKAVEVLTRADVMSPYRLGDDALAQEVLRPALGTLYQKTLLFLIRAACNSNRSRAGNLFRDAIKLDDWDKSLQEIQYAEREVLKLDQDIKQQRTAQYQAVVLAETRDEKDKACLARIMVTDPRLDKKRIEANKGGLLRDSYCWIFDMDEFKSWRRDGGLLWIKGDPGKGKTMLLCGIIDEVVNSSSAYFFCQATDKALNTGISVLRGLIYMLADSNPILIALIRQRLDKSNAVFDANSWYLFSDILESMISTETCIVIDALDECIEGRSELIKFIKRNQSRAKWIVSSRNWSDIAEEFRNTPLLSLETNSSLVAQAVRYYIQFKVNELTQLKEYDSETRDFVLDYLQEYANDTFLWVALVCMNLANVRRRHVRSTIQKFPSGLQEVYQRMWQMVEQKDDSELLQSILAVNAVVMSPITTMELQIVLEVPEEALLDIEEVIQDCGSFLMIRDGTIEFVHQSAKEHIDKKTQEMKNALHLDIATRSMAAMSRVLRKDIYGLEDPAVSIDEVNEPEPCPLTSIRYSCFNWIPHLTAHASISAVVEDLIQKFLMQHFLPWIEAMSLSRSIPAALSIIHDLERLVQQYSQHKDDQSSTSYRDNADLKATVYDARRLLQSVRPVSETYPLQIYYAGLLLTPESSIIRQAFSQMSPSSIQVVRHAETRWSSNLAQFETRPGENPDVSAVCFSHDSRRLAVAYFDGVIEIWHLVALFVLQTTTLKDVEAEKTQAIRGLAFTHDDHIVVCYDSKGTVTIWNILENRLATLALPNSLNISPDGRLVARSISASVQFYDILESSPSPSPYRSIDVAVYLSGDETESEPKLFTENTLVFSGSSDRVAIRTAMSKVEVWSIKHPQRICSMTIDGTRLFAMALGTKSLSTCSAIGDIDAFGDCSIMIETFHSERGESLWTQSIHGFSTFCGTQIRISQDDQFLAVAGFESYIFDMLSGTQIWRSQNGQVSWLSPSLDLMVSFLGRGYSMILQSWSQPQSGTSPTTDLPERTSTGLQVRRLSPDAQRMEVYFEDNDFHSAIIDINSGCELWQSIPTPDDRYQRNIFSDSLQLMVMTDVQQQEMRTKKLQNSGFQTVFTSKSLLSERLQYRWFFAPDDSLVVRVASDKDVEVIDLAGQGTILSLRCTSRCDTVQWSPDSRTLALCTSAGLMIIRLAEEDYILHMNGVTVMSFSEDGSSFVTLIEDSTKIESTGIIAEDIKMVSKHENPQDSRKWLFIRDWQTDRKIIDGDWMEWNISKQFGHHLNCVDTPRCAVVRNEGDRDETIKKVCFNSYFLVILYLLEYYNPRAISTVVRVWDRASGTKLYNTYVRGRFQDSPMSLKGKHLQLDGGIIVLGSEGVRFGFDKEIFFDGDWIWKDDRRLIYVFQEYGGSAYHSRYSNGTLAIGRDYGGITVLRSV